MNKRFHMLGIYPFWTRLSDKSATNKTSYRGRQTPVRDLIADEASLCKVWLYVDSFYLILRIFQQK